jgi:hypothetical protein
MRITIVKESRCIVNRTGNKIKYIEDREVEWAVVDPKKSVQGTGQILTRLKYDTCEIMDVLARHMFPEMSFSDREDQIAELDIILSKRPPKGADLLFSFTKETDNDGDDEIIIRTNNDSIVDTGCWKYNTDAIQFMVYEAGYRYMALEYEEDDIIGYK